MQPRVGGGGLAAASAASLRGRAAPSAERAPTLHTLRLPSTPCAFPPPFDEDRPSGAAGRGVAWSRLKELWGADTVLGQQRQALPVDVRGIATLKAFLESALLNAGLVRTTPVPGYHGQVARPRRPRPPEQPPPPRFGYGHPHPRPHAVRPRVWSRWAGLDALPPDGEREGRGAAARGEPTRLPPPAAARLPSLHAEGELTPPDLLLISLRITPHVSRPQARPERAAPRGKGGVEEEEDDDDDDDEDEDDEDEDIVCSICREGDDDENNEILLCDGPGCRVGTHQHCLSPPLTELPEGSWHGTAGGRRAAS